MIEVSLSRKALVEQAREAAKAAWIARTRGDADEAIRLAAELRSRFPDHPAGYQIGSAAAREMGRLDEASAIISEGTARFPTEAWPAAEAVRIARARGKFDEALRLAAELRSRFPDHPAGYQIGAAVACELRRFEEALAVLSQGMVRFPSRPWPVAQAARVNRVRGDAYEASRLAAELRSRFPNDSAGYQIGAAAARDLRRLDEASAIIVQGMARFPAEAWPVAQAAWTAKARGDFNEVKRLTAELRSRFPGHPAGGRISEAAAREIEEAPVVAGAYFETALCDLSQAGVERPPKIFGVGLSRTGTKSLNRALGILGFRSVHYPRPDQLCGILKHHDAATDTPVACIFRELDAAYPGSRFILTVREIQSWLASMEQFYSRPVPESPVVREVRLRTYGALQWNRQTFQHAYQRHIETVLDYFSDRPGRLLIINIVAGEGWNVLCPFLKRSVPPEAFPNIRYPERQLVWEGLRARG